MAVGTAILPSSTNDELTLWKIGKNFHNQIGECESNHRRQWNENHRFHVGVEHTLVNKVNKHHALTLTPRRGNSDYANALFFSNDIYPVLGANEKSRFRKITARCCL